MNIEGDKSTVYTGINFVKLTSSSTPAPVVDTPTEVPSPTDTQAETTETPVETPVDIPVDTPAVTTEMVGDTTEVVSDTTQSAELPPV